VTEVNSRLPHHFGRILSSCLTKDPARRYQTALDLRNKLEALRDEIDSGARESPIPTSRPSGFRPLVIALAGISVLALAAAVYLLLRSGTVKPTPEPLQPTAATAQAKPGDYLVASRLTGGDAVYAVTPGTNTLRTLFTVPTSNKIRGLTGGPLNTNYYVASALNGKIHHSDGRLTPGCSACSPRPSRHRGVHQGEYQHT